MLTCILSVILAFIWFGKQLTSDLSILFASLVYENEEQRFFDDDFCFILSRKNSTFAPGNAAFGIHRNLSCLLASFAGILAAGSNRCITIQGLGRGLGHARTTPYKMKEKIFRYGTFLVCLGSVRKAGCKTPFRHAVQ
ncbi:MAG: hypothetical protein ACI4BA_09115, partial [Prevotella sp.]